MGEKYIKHEEKWKLKLNLGSFGSENAVDVPTYEILILCNKGGRYATKS